MSEYLGNICWLFAIVFADMVAGAALVPSIVKRLKREAASMSEREGVVELCGRIEHKRHTIYWFWVLGKLSQKTRVKLVF